MGYNILITGSNGQLGSEIKNIADDFSQFSFFFTDVDKLDITNEKHVFDFVNTNNIDFIINCAAYTAVDKAEEDQIMAHKINVIGTKNLKNAAKNKNIPLIHISTDYVFDGKNHKPYKETNPTSPQSIYGKTKLDGELAILDYKKAVIIRTSWLYSIFGNNFVKTIIKIATKNDQIKVVSDQIGSPTNAADLAFASLKITEQIFEKDEVDGGIYHFSNEGVCSWYDFAKNIISLKSITCDIKAVNSDEFPRPAPRPFYSVLDKSKIKSTFNLSIPHWTDSLKLVLSKI